MVVVVADVVMAVSHTMGSAGAEGGAKKSCTTPSSRCGNQKSRAVTSLFEGDSAIYQTPAGTSYYTYTLGGAAVCFGDSGGGAYVYTTPDHTQRFVIGVNSRGNIATRSLLSTTHVAGFRTWAETWSADNGVEICGIHPGATDCRPQ